MEKTTAAGSKRKRDEYPEYPQNTDTSGGDAGGKSWARDRNILWN